MEAFAIAFTKNVKNEDPKPTMVILAKPDGITAYGLSGISGIIVDDMNERFSRLSSSEIASEAKRLRSSYTSDSTGYGSSVTVLPYAQNKGAVDKMIKKLMGERSNSVIKRVSRGRV